MRTTTNLAAPRVRILVRFDGRLPDVDFLLQKPRHVVLYVVHQVHLEWSGVEVVHDDDGYDDAAIVIDADGYNDDGDDDDDDDDDDVHL